MYVALLFTSSNKLYKENNTDKSAIFLLRQILNYSIAMVGGGA